MNRETGKHPPEGKQQQAGERRRKKRMSWQKKLLIVIGVLLALVLIGFLAWKSLFIKPDLPQSGSDPAEEEEIDWGEGTRPRADGERKSKDWYTVLILGRDTGGGGNTDTILLASYDVTNQKATVMSIPRDTMVNVSWDIKRINSVYNAHHGGDKGIQALYKEISQLVGFAPDFQVVVEWEAVGQIVDAMDGVWFDVPRNMNYEDPYQDLSIHQEKGYRLLSGDDAMQVLRYRHDTDMRYGYPDGDLGRIKTQQAFLTAMVEQLLKLENFTKVNKFIDVFRRNVETDLSFKNILWFAQSAYLGGLSMENVRFLTMPNRPAECWSRTYHNLQSYVTPKAEELLELVNSDLSPFAETFSLSDLDIMSVNEDGSISSSTGYVEDKKAARPPVRPAKPKPQERPKPQEEEKPPVDEYGNVLDPVTGLPLVPQPGTPEQEGGTIVTPVDPGTVPPAGTETPVLPDVPPAPPEPLPPEPAEPVPPPVPSTPNEDIPAQPDPVEPGFSVIEPQTAA